MELLKCECCGSTTLSRQLDGLYKCEFCNSLFFIETNNKTSKSDSNMSNTSQPVYDNRLSKEDFIKVIELAVETGNLSTSIVQRTLKVGYANAARAIDELEEIGIVGPFVGIKPRTVLITKDMWIKTKDEILKRLKYRN